MKFNLEKCLMILGVIILLNLIIFKVNCNKIYVKEIYMNEYVKTDIKNEDILIKEEMSDNDEIGDEKEQISTTNGKSTGNLDNGEVNGGSTSTGDIR